MKDSRITIKGLHAASPTLRKATVEDNLCALSNPKARKIVEDARNRQVQMALEGNEYAAYYLAICAGMEEEGLI